MFTINGEQWEIWLVPANHPALQRSDGTFTIGVCDDNTKSVYVSREIKSEQLLKKVICHEIVHVAMFAYNVNLTTEEEEIIADIIATYGREIIHITDFLFEQLNKNRGIYYL